MLTAADLSNPHLVEVLDTVDRLSRGSEGTDPQSRSADEFLANFGPYLEHLEHAKPERFDALCRFVEILGDKGELSDLEFIDDLRRQRAYLESVEVQRTKHLEDWEREWVELWRLLKAKDPDLAMATLESLQAIARETSPRR